jgi:hypothetical protein
MKRARKKVGMKVVIMRIVVGQGYGSGGGLDGIGREFSYYGMKIDPVGSMVQFCSIVTLDSILNSSSLKI